MISCANVEARRYRAWTSQRHLEASSPRRHHGAGRHAVPTPERTMTPVRHKIRALVGEAAIREHWLRRRVPALQDKFRCGDDLVGFPGHHAGQDRPPRPARCGPDADVYPR